MPKRDCVIAAGQAGMWDEGGAGHPTLCLGPDSLLRLLYHGFPNKGIGAAVMKEKGNLSDWQRL